MIQHLIYFFIGISLSMDAFAVAISLGGLINSNRKRLFMTSLISIFHLIMPLIGNSIGLIITKRILLNTRIINFLIFTLLGIGILLDKRKEETIKTINYLTLIIIAFTVSIDSLTVGIALGIAKENIISASIIFSATSYIFTYFGLTIGKRLKKKYNLIADYLGVFLLFLIAIKYLLFG